MRLRAALVLRRALPGAVLVLAACSSESTINKYVPNIVTPYRMDIQQGNFVTQDMVDKLQKGQTRDQVRFILGTPLLTDAFHASRWDYVFRFSKGWNDPEKHSLTVFFGPDDKLAEWAGDVPPPKSQEPVAEDKGFFGWLGKSSTPKPAVAGAGSTGAAVVAAGDAAAVERPAAAPVASPTAEAMAQPPANAQVLGATTQAAPAAPDKKEPGLMRRMFGWLPGVSTEDAAASANRAASPDNTPTPRPTVSNPPPRPEPAEPAPSANTSPVGAVSPATSPAPAPAAAQPQAPPATASLSAPPLIASPMESPAAVAQAVPKAESVAPAPAAADVPAAAPASAVVPSASSAPAPAFTPTGVLRAIERWRAAWQAKDVTAYLAAYAPDFMPANNLTRAKWEAQRRERLTKPSFIVVRVKDPRVTLGSDDVAVAVFEQEYQSNTFKENGRKTLRLARFGMDWLIIEENSK